MPGWVNIDSQYLVHPEICRKIEDGLPFTDNSVEVFNARAVLEHVPQDRLIFVMREVFRCLKPGGLLYVMVPHWNQKWMWSDPTHHTGWDRRMMDWFLGQNKPSDIGIDFAFEEAHYHPIYFPEGRSVVSQLGLSLEEGAAHIANVIDAHVWWLRKPGEGGPDWQEVESSIRAMKIYPNGYEGGDGRVAKPVPVPSTVPAVAPIPVSKQHNKLLWFINVAEVGGTALWALDAIRSLKPIWHHTVCYLYGEAHPSIEQQFINAGCDFAKAGEGITRKLVESVNPSAIILSNSNPKQIEGGHPYEWLTGNYSVFYVHHSAVRPWLPKARADIFVSEYLKSQYSNLFQWMNDIIVAPSGINPTPFLDIPIREKPNPVIGRLCTNHPAKFPVDFLQLLERVAQAHPSTQIEIVGGAEHYKKSVQGVRWLPFCSPEEVPKTLARWDIFLYRTGVKETWGRVVAEAMASGLAVVAERKGGIPELVEHGVSGFLFDDDDEALDYVDQLISHPQKRSQMGVQARHQIRRITGENPFKKHLEPVLIQTSLMG